MHDTPMSFGGQRPHSFYFLCLFILAFLQVPSLPAAGDTTPPPGVAPVDPPAGGFAIDGDLEANTTTPGIGDWMTGPDGAGGAVLDAAGFPNIPRTTMHVIDSYGNSGEDVIFAGGLKWFDNPNTWQWTMGKASSKTDINNVLFHIAADAEGHVWAMISADRLSTSGDSYIDFEFLQNTLSKKDDGSFVSEGPEGGRTVNDLLLSLAFTGGGKVADFYIWTWQPDGNGGYAYVDANGSRPEGRVFAALNNNSIPVPYGAFGDTSYSRYSFVEGAVDLTALLNNFDPCMSLLIRTIMVKTKSSQSSTASIADLIDPLQVTLTIGPSADAGPDQTRCMEGDSTAFPLEGVATQGLLPATAASWSLVEGTATIDDPNALSTTAHVSSDTATLRLTVYQDNGCIETDEVILTVAPLPNCAITGPTGDLCPGTIVEYSAPQDMAAYAWSLAGNGAFSGPTDGQSVLVMTGTDCASPFTLTLTVVSNDCGNTCSLEIMVDDTVAPSLTLPPDLVLECLEDTGINATGVATAQDDCGPVTVTHNDLVTDLCGGTFLIERVWTATDHCGNTASASQKITVQDTQGPVVTCPMDITIDCTASTAPENTGQATAADSCSGVKSLSYSDSVAAGNCADNYVITRIWTATDHCDNTSQKTQIITVEDTHPPVLTCPPNVTIDCSTSSDPAQTGTATASDDCSGVDSITYSDVIQAGNCAGSYTITRTWTAIDLCGNASQATQRITVQDTSGPILTCPPDVTIDCAASSDVANTGIATATDDCSDVASITHSDAIQAGTCAGRYTITRTWTATDLCGNATQAAQVITVQDTRGPVLLCPPDVTIDCTASSDVTDTGIATATDDCSDVASLTHSDSIRPGNCAGNYVIIRTWTALDYCGNLTQADQKITVQDTTPPQIICPPDVTVECSDSTAPQDLGRATASDDCSAVAKIEFQDAITPGDCSGNYLITRTWMATDSCGNASTCNQIITVQDTHPPQIQCGVACTYSQGGYGGSGSPGEILANHYLEAFPNGLMIGIYDDSNGNTAPNGLLWEGTPAGLSALRQFLSQGGGSGESLPRDLFNLSEQLKLGGLVNQSITLTLNIRFNELGVIGVGPNNFGSLIYTRPGDSLSGFTVNQILEAANRALAGLGVPAGQSFNSLASLVESLNMSFHAYDISNWAASYLDTPSIVVQCAGEVPAPNASRIQASDSCSSRVTVWVEPDAITDLHCANQYVILRTWVAADDCGNMATCEQRIIVHDTTPPVLVGEQERFVSAGETWDFKAPAASDNCSADVTVAVVSTVTNVLGDNALVATRTWEVADACGNTTPFQQTVTVGDTFVVRSTFDSNTDRWRVFSITGEQDPIHLLTGGAAGGFVWSEINGDGFGWFWAAPTDYLGDRSTFYGGVLTFSLQQTALPASGRTNYVVLSGATGLWLVFELPQSSGTDWTTYNIPLHEKSGWISWSLGRPATQAEMVSVLSSLTDLLIWVDYGLETTAAGLDNVFLVPPSTAPSSGWILEWSRTAQGKLHLTWPILARDYQLEISDSLSAPNWRRLPTTPTVMSGLNHVEFTPAEGQQNFRLHRP